MSFRFPPCAALFACLAWPALSAAAAEAPRAETPAEKIKQALAQARDLDVTDQPLDVAVNQLREQTGVNLVIDQPAVPSLGVALGMVPGQSPYQHIRVTARSEGQPVRDALAKALRPHGLTVVVVGDTALVTTPEKAVERQLGQAVHLDADGVPLRDLLQRLGRDTGANLVLDQRLAREGQTAVTARLDAVPLETAVEVLADQAGLKAVRMSNVLYVTTEARAEKLHKPAPPTAPTGGWQVWPDGTGGFRLLPPAGANPVGLIGFGGLGGLIGNGTGPAVGMAGFAGALGNAGGPGGGVVQPVPLTPPTRPPAAKPKAEVPPPPARPVITPAAPAAPPPPPAPDKKTGPAAPPKSAAPKSGRRLRRSRTTCTAT